MDTKLIPALIVDDNWFNRDILRIALESCGYRVSQAEDGAQGLEMLQQAPFQLLILDLLMPNLDGTSTLKALRSNPVYKNLQVVVVTANAHLATEEVKKMANYVLYKPVNLQEFAQLAMRLRATGSS